MGLMNYINSDMNNPLYAMAFSSAAMLQDYLHKSKLDLIIISYDIAEELQENILGTTKLIYLTKDSLGKEYNTPDCSYVFKYIRAAYICDTAVSMLDKGKPRIKNNIYRSYAVISPIGRCGKTRLAKAVCSLDEVRGGLYVGMEAYSSTSNNGYLSCDDSSISADASSDILYMIKNRDEQLIDFVEKNIVSENGIGVIPSPLIYQDIKNLNKDDMSWYIEQLVEWGRYTSIVFDIASSVLYDISCLEAFDYILMPVLSDEISRVKINSFYNMLKVYELHKMAGRIVEITVPDVDIDNPIMIREIEKCIGGNIVG